jgi:hypothetical protein
LWQSLSLSLSRSFSFVCVCSLVSSTVYTCYICQRYHWCQQLVKHVSS